MPSVAGLPGGSSRAGRRVAAVDPGPHGYHPTPCPGVRWPSIPTIPGSSRRRPPRPRSV